MTFRTDYCGVSQPMNSFNFTLIPARNKVLLEKYSRNIIHTFCHYKHKTYLLQPPINFFIAYPIAIPIVYGQAGRAYQKILGVSGESQSP